MIDFRALADEHAHRQHRARLDDHALNHFRACADEAVVLNDGGVGLKRFQYTANADGIGTLRLLEALRILKRVLGNNTRWRMYVRQVKAALRTEPGFDERRYGFNSPVELLRMAQREGLVRLDGHFLRALQDADAALAQRLRDARAAPPAATTLRSCSAAG